MSATKRLRALRTKLHAERLFALVIHLHEGASKNIRYLTGFGGSSATLLIGRKKALLAVDGRYVERARLEARGVNVIPVSGRRGNEYERTADILTTLLTKLGLAKAARVGFESDHVSVALAAVLKRRVVANLIPTIHLVERLRQYKDENEIGAIKEACRVTDAVFRRILPRIKAGLRERDVAMLIDHEHRRRGAVLPSFPTIVASGPNSAMPHHETGSRVLRAGDPVVLDFGGLFPSGYCSDLSRTIFVPGKRPHPKLLLIYRIVREANRLARQSLNAGMSWKEYNAGAARTYIESNGYGKEFLHSVGHSLGLDVHDPFDYAHDRILPGTILTDEPGIYLEGLGGVRIEDDLLMTKRGAVRLTRAPYLVF